MNRPCTVLFHALVHKDAESCAFEPNKAISPTQAALLRRHLVRGFNRAQTGADVQTHMFSQVIAQQMRHNVTAERLRKSTDSIKIEQRVWDWHRIDSHSHRRAGALNTSVTSSK